MKLLKVTHIFVEEIPEELAEGKIYVSVEYATAAHLCCCGCGQRVITPLSPHDWSISFNGETVSVHPSIGNWSFNCRSHYWIRNNKIDWAAEWSTQQIDMGRHADRSRKNAVYSLEPSDKLSSDETPDTPKAVTRSSWSHRFMHWLTGRR